MPATAFKKLKAWLATYPRWEDCPANFCLLPKSVEETSRQADVLGNNLVGYRYAVTLYWQMAGQGDEEEDACRLLDFQNWVREQSVLGLAPELGDMPALERIRAEKGGFTPGAQIVTYTVSLVADFVKAYDVN